MLGKVHFLIWFPIGILKYLDVTRYLFGVLQSLMIKRVKKGFGK